MKNKKLIKLVDDLYWDYERLSSSGQETLDNIADLLGIPAENELEKGPNNG
jgi:hypothetical protein